MYKLIEITRSVLKWGNSAGVLLPKEWIGNEAKIILIDRTSQIKKEVFEILDSYLEDILGIYLVGSYARHEQEKYSDIDIIAISSKTKKEIKSGKYSISIIPIESIKKTLKSNPIMIYPRLIEAKTILNHPLVEELKAIKITKISFKEFIEDTKRIIKINKEFIELDKLEGNRLTSISIIYSLILRLRGIFIVKCLLDKKKYSKKLFLKWLETSLGEKTAEVYRIYTYLRDEKKIKEKIEIKTAESLLNLLKMEIKRYE